uniref:Uncharacterized protein n=1 Tax=Oryza meridionalis TaxID=40149 RepID=A0A0E0EHZ0_9ORYZ
MAILCFCPPESWLPLSPTTVSYPFDRPLMNSWIFPPNDNIVKSNVSIALIYQVDVFFEQNVLHKRDLALRNLQQSYKC